MIPLHVDFVTKAIGTLPVARCPLCHDGKRRTARQLYDHVLGHPIGDLHWWLHAAGTSFRVEAHSGMWEWECKCSAMGRMHKSELAARSHHKAAHRCPDCHGCKADAWVEASL